MGKIKSALEIALERTESVKTDKASVDLYKARQEGKRIANDYLADQAKGLAAALKGQPEDRRKSLCQGILDVLVPQIMLPEDEEGLPRIKAVGEGLGLILKDRRFAEMFGQLMQLLDGYLQEVDRLDQGLRQQYAPKLRQKEEEVSRRLGQEVRLDPMQDPEFAVFYNQHMGSLRANYQVPLDQVKEEALRLWGLQS
ncbi:MAG: hypothetical protein FWD94_00115 [Treponema sp.]|nr:hypothetical protein [Treponema sp.]